MIARALVGLTLVLSVCNLLASNVYHGQVVKIADGDTLTLLSGTQQLKIRLADIDTPEKGQPFGTKAKQALSELAFGKQARVVEVDVDRYGRIVGGLRQWDECEPGAGGSWDGLGVS